MFGVRCRRRAPSPAAGRLTEVFAHGNALYEQGDYEGAIEQYSSLVDKGVTDTDLYYNLANSYYKTGDFGRAVLFYERARRLAPRDRDVRENLALVRAQLRDKQFVRDENRLVRAARVAPQPSQRGEMTLAASLCYAAALSSRNRIRAEGDAVGVRRVPLVSRTFRSAGSPASRKRRISLAAHGGRLASFVSTGISAYQKDAERESPARPAVVLSEEVAVISGPTDDTTLQFKIHEGTLVQRQRSARTPG